jgi:hypothetical protein
MLQGRISESRMHAIYERTRRLGGADHAHFHAALPSADQLATCDKLRSVGHSESLVVQDCLSRAAVGNRALAAASAVMADWQSHLQHMEQYDDGGMSTGTALRLWVKAWRQAPANISTYRDTRAALAEAPPCPGASVEN